MDTNAFLIEQEFDAARAKGWEGLFTLGSGYLHVRGSFEEHLSGAPQNVTYLRRPANVTAEKFPTMKVKWGTFVPGIYGLHPLMGKEMANLPYFLGIVPSIDGEALNLEQAAVADYRRALHFETATLARTLRWTTRSGAVVRVVFERFVSAARPHLCVQRLTLSSDRAATLTLRAGIDADVRTSGYDHFTAVSFVRAAADTIRCDVTLDTGDTVSTAARLLLADADWQYADNGRTAELSAALTLAAGQTVTLEKRSAVITSFDTEPLDLLDLLAPALDYDALHAEHAAVWRERWTNADVIVDGDDVSQVALRTAIYHLLRAHPNDSRLAIDPKAYAGDAYRGLYFWDTEMYLLPFFLYTDPARARLLTDFRIQTLGGALKNAREYGYSGARYPWEGDRDGIDQCPNWQYRDHEVHVTADVVYGIAHYAQASGDADYLRRAGDVLRETSRYWLERIDWRKGDRFPSLLGVMGPDEYTPISANNAYTNRLVALALAYAAPFEADARVGEKLAAIARLLPIPRRADGLVLQCEEFEHLADLNFGDFWHDRSKPFAAQVAQERLYRSKCLKQADVLLLMQLFPQEFSDAEVAQAWDYYLPYTTHDSSLSPGVHAIVALRLGLLEQAWAFWQQSYGIDLNGGAEEGIHIASAGMNWQIAVFGFGGLQTAMNTDRLTLTPHLPDRWTRLAFPVIWGGQRAYVDIRPGVAKVSNHSDAPLIVTVAGASAIVPARGLVEFALGK